MIFFYADWFLAFIFGRILENVRFHVIFATILFRPMALCANIVASIPVKNPTLAQWYVV